MPQGISDVINEIKASQEDPAKGRSVLSIACMITMECRARLQEQIKGEVIELKTRLDKVQLINKLRREINAAKQDGKIDCADNKKLQDLLEQVQELNLDDSLNEEGDATTIPGIVEGKTKYSKDEVENLMDSLGTAIDDLNTKNTMQQQKINRLMNYDVESIQIASQVLRMWKDLGSKFWSGIGR